MKRALLLFFVGILLLTAQTTFLKSLLVQTIRPDVLFIYTIYLGLSCPPIPGGILAFFLGYLIDLFSGNSFGLYTFSRPLVFYGAHFFKNRFYVEGFLFQFFFVLVFVLLEGLLVLLLLLVLNPGPLYKLYPSFLTILLPQSIFTGAVTPLLFTLFERGWAFYSGKARAASGEGG